MTPGLEKRLLQLVIAITCLVPLGAGAAGVVLGPGWLERGTETLSADLNSHFRYLSGLLFALGIAAAACVPQIENKGRRFMLIGGMVATGGLARLLSIVVAGVPSDPHLAGLGIELVLVPLLVLWQMRIDRRYRAIGPRRDLAPHPLLSKKRREG